MSKKVLTTLFSLFLMTTSVVVYGETDDPLRDCCVLRDGLYYKKFTDVPFTGVISEGRSRGELKNGLKQGTWFDYHEDGQLWEKGKFVDGKQNGEWVQYYDNGQLRWKGNLVNGKEEGESVKYYENGQLWEKGKFVDGKQNGEWVSYHENGQLRWKGNWFKGVFHGEWVVYHENGSIIQHLTGFYKYGLKQ